MTDFAFTPVTLGPLTLRNRFIKTATYEGMVHDNAPNELLARHHERLAEGGVGMTTLAYCAVSPEGRTFEQQMYMREAIVPGLGRICDRVHAHGAAVALQLGHCGYFTKNDALGHRPKGPSKGWNAYGLMKGLGRVEPMSAADMERTAGEFAAAARLAEQAGFDAVELHLGHGYLLSQFLSPGTNHRGDGYGGSVEGRMRFPLEVVRRVLDAVGGRIAVIAKTNLRDGFEGGLEVDDAVAVARALEREGVDAIEMSGGFVDKNPLYLLRGDRPLRDMIDVEPNRLQKVALRVFGSRLIKAQPFEPLFFLEDALRVRAAVKTPLILLGGVISRAGVARAMDAGFECVALGRALLYDPRFVRKLERGEEAPSGCNHCNVCITEMDRPGGVCCADQPAQLDERARAVAKGLHEQLA
ncbi:MAG: NADH:flavin oxidoreductase [Myxococcales bacterium]|nr:NADH:flavin oxidoreductase [Myxococcales bacterium]